MAAELATRSRKPRIIRKQLPFTKAAAKSVVAVIRLINRTYVLSLGDEQEASGPVTRKDSGMVWAVRSACADVLRTARQVSNPVGSAVGQGPAPQDIHLADAGTEPGVAG